MKHFSLLLTVLLVLIPLSFLSCRKDCLPASRQTERICNVGTFHSIYASDPITVSVKKSNTFRVVVKGTPEDVLRVSCTIAGGVLDVAYTEPPVGVVKCTIELPVVSGLRVAGGTNAMMYGFAQQPDLFTMVCSGRAKARIDGMPRNVNIEIGGFATAELYGSTDSLQGQISTEGRLYGYGLNAKNVQLQLWQSAKAWVRVDRSIDAMLSGDAKLYYKGEPVLRSFRVMNNAEVIHE